MGYGFAEVVLAIFVGPTWENSLEVGSRVMRIASSPEPNVSGTKHSITRA